MTGGVMLDEAITELERVAQVKSPRRKVKRAIQNTVRQLSIDVCSKYEGMQFRADILERYPWWFRKVDALAHNYGQLILDLTYIVNENDKKEKLLHWLNRYEKCKSDENCLMLDSMNLELGSDP